MITAPLAAAVRTCVRFTRRRVAVAPPKLTMQQAAALLAPRPRIVRRAVALGCPAAALPTTMLVPGAPVPLPVPPAVPPAVPPSMPLPYGIGTGDILPPLDGLPGIPTLRIYDVAGPAAAGVPEPSTLAVLLVAVAMLAAALLWRRPA